MHSDADQPKLPTTNEIVCVLNLMTHFHKCMWFDCKYYHNTAQAMGGFQWESQRKGDIWYPLTIFLYAILRGLGSSMPFCKIESNKRQKPSETNLAANFEVFIRISTISLGNDSFTFLLLKSSATFFNISSIADILWFCKVWTSFWYAWMLFLWQKQTN